MRPGASPLFHKSAASLTTLAEYPLDCYTFCESHSSIVGTKWLAVGRLAVCRFVAGGLVQIGKSLNCFDRLAGLMETSTSTDASSQRTLGVIFDMDGVLVDSYRAHWQSWHFMADELGKGLTEAQFVSTFGRTSREIIAEHWGANCLTVAEIAEFDRRKEGLYRELVDRDFPAMEGAIDLIRALAASGFRLAVGSSGPPENVALAVERLGAKQLFNTLVTGRDVARGKPDPQVFLLAGERLGVAPADCAVIEDAPVGIAAANAAGMASIALLSTGHTAESVQAARLIVDSLCELSPERITRLIGP